MVKDRNNFYYTTLLNAIKSEYSDIKGGTTSKSTPPSIPYLHYKQLDSPTKLKTMSNTEDGIDLAIEINIYSKKSLNDCRSMANLARAVLVELGFTIDRFKQEDNVNDLSIYRYLIRCSKLEV